MKKWKKNIIAASVLLVVCAGIYMNWMFTNGESVADLTDPMDCRLPGSSVHGVFQASVLEWGAMTFIHR